MSVLEDLRQSIIDGDSPQAQELVNQALAENISAEQILNDGLIAAMAEVGRLFEEGEFFVPEMLISARAMQKGLGLLKPYLKQADVKSAGKVAIGTVKGDLHDIGKNLVAMMLEGGGFEIQDLGDDVPVERFVEAARNGAQILAMSALLTTTMVNMRSVVEAVQAAGLRDQVKIIIGGAPITQKFAESIGADGFAMDASRAVNLAHSLLAQAA